MTPVTEPTPSDQPTPLESVVVRFAGDSGDGMQLAGTQFTDTSAVLGNDVATLPDFPAEIRAPAGTVAGVSGFQINFASRAIHTPGDKVHALIAMNPAAFHAHIEDVEPGGIVIANDSEFEKVNLRKAGYEEHENPLDDEAYTRKYRIYRVPITRLNQEALEDTGLSTKDINRCKNMYALGVVYWLYDRPLETTVEHLNDYFGRKKDLPHVAEANINALKAGYYFGETAELFPARYQVPRADIPPGRYRKLTGNEALAMGLTTASRLSDKGLIYCSYPITPASDVLHAMAAWRHFGVKTFQAEDEIAAVCAAIGAAFAGRIGVCGTSGPGLALKQEAIGLAVMTELPLIVCDIQRGGPSTGLPTKTEQSDLLAALFGRNGDSSVLALAPQSPADCFDTALEAVRLSLTFMTPAIILGEGYLANGAEPWRIRSPEDFEPIHIDHSGADTFNHPGTGTSAPVEGDDKFQPYARDDNLVRPWAIPGMPGAEHRLGGLEKQDGTGNVSYDAGNHQRMTELRQAKVQKAAERIPPVEPFGDGSGQLLVLGWGGTYGAILTAVQQAREQGKSVSTAHLRHLSPLPSNLGQVLARFRRVMIPELNAGQLRSIIRGKFLVDAKGLNKIAGKPLLVEELTQAIDLMLSDQWGERESLSPHHHQVRVNEQA